MSCDTDYVLVPKFDPPEWRDMSTVARAVFVFLLRVSGPDLVVQMPSDVALANLLRVPLRWVQVAVPELERCGYICLDGRDLVISGEVLR